MRKIKYRQHLKPAYRAKGDIFHYWGFIDGGFVSPVGKNVSIHNGDQYTGLKDKNGKGTEMCQGDLVRAYGHGVGEVDKNTWGEWILVFNDGTETIHDLMMEQDLGEIVGTKYENPELLEQTK